MEVRTIEVGGEQPAEPLELCCLPFELQLLCASHVRDGRDLAALRAAASWATALVDGAVSPLTLFAWHLRARRARASARTVHAPRGKPLFIVLRTAHALRLVGGMQTPGLCCGHRQRPMHEHTIAGSWAACSFGIRHTVCVRADGAVGVSGRARTRGVVASFWQIFGKMLFVFGCIGTDFCKKICVLQHFSKSTRLSS